MAALTTCQVLAHALPIDFIIERGGKKRHVQSETIGMAIQGLAIQFRGPLNQAIVHFPETSLRGSGFRCFSRHQCMRVRSLNGKVAVHQSHRTGELAQHHLYGGRAARQIGHSKSPYSTMVARAPAGPRT